MTLRSEPNRAPAQAPTPGGIWKMLRGGTAGNARLTALSGLIILVLLAAEGFTFLNIRAFVTPHAFIGLLLIPPVGLKLASVGYRFITYYMGNARYRAIGPPHLVPRVLAPFLVASTIALLATGVILLVTRPGEGGGWRQIHTIAFFVWFGLMTAHVLAYVLRALGLAQADVSGGREHKVAGAMDRRALVAGSLILGVALAIAFLPWDTTWANWLGAFRRDH